MNIHIDKRSGLFPTSSDRYQLASESRAIDRGAGYSATDKLLFHDLRLDGFRLAAMDDARPILLAVASSLGRLQVRMLRLSNRQLVVSQGRLARVTSSQWTVADLSPPSEWLEATPPRTSLSGAIAAVALAQVHLLAMIEAEGPIDGRQACRVVWHISCGGGWSPILLRLAAHLGISLAGSPLEETHGASLHESAIPERRRGQGWTPRP